MPAPCSPSHVLCVPLPEGLALHPLFGRRFPDSHDWLPSEALLARIVERPTVYLDMGKVEYISSCGIANVIRLGVPARDRGGRIVLCNAGPYIRQILEVVRMDRLHWLEVRDGGMPGGGRPLAAPAWLSWGGGVVAAMARSFAEGRDLGQMPVLADALEEAGCTLGDVLGHCRDPVPHSRDCWVVRLLLEAR